MSLREEKLLLEFEQTARRYCLLIESSPTDKAAWHREVLASLASLYAAGHHLPAYDLPEDSVEPPDSLDVTQEDLFPIIRQLNANLSKQSSYRTYFDPTLFEETPDQLVIGALWDDLADIYRDVKPGLKAWDTGRDEYLHHIAFDWREPNFGCHWGIHAVNAMRALHWLVFDGRLDDDRANVAELKTEH